MEEVGWDGGMSEIVESIEEVSGLYFRSILLPKGCRVPQHVHDYDHATLVGSGKAALYVGGILSGIYDAGRAVPIQAGQRHEFEALEDGTRLICVHDVESAMSIKEKGL